MTFYRSSEELPDFEDYSMKGRTYRYMQQQALYPFGYGQSYTTFDYSNVTVDSGMLSQDGITLRARVKNTGTMAGAETVQAYVKIEREGTPNAQLKGIRKLRLAPGEEGEAVIHLPREAFGLYDEEGVLRIRKGRARVCLGGQAPDARSEALTGRKVWALDVAIPEDMA